MKKLLLFLLLVPMVSFGQYGINYYVDGVLTYSEPPASLESLRASSEECKTIFVNSVNSFYDEDNDIVTIIFSEDFNSWVYDGQTWTRR